MLRIAKVFKDVGRGGAAKLTRSKPHRAIIRFSIKALSVRFTSVFALWSKNLPGKAGRHQKQQFFNIN